MRRIAGAAFSFPAFEDVKTPLLSLKTSVGCVRVIQFLSCSLFSLTLLSCGCSGPGCNDSQRPQSFSYEQIQAAQRAHETRVAYHRQEREKELPQLPEPVAQTMLPPRRYYEVPVEEHTAPDGVIIDAHKLTLEIIQP